MTQRSTATAELAAFVTTLGAGDLPDRVADDARWRLLDTVGVALAGSRLDYAAALRDVMGELGGHAQATTIGFGQRLPATTAAFVDAALAHGPDFDDTHSVAMVHIGCLVVPAALAVAERTGASGREMLTAMVAGAEVGLRIGAAAPHRFHMRGYHATGVVGPFAAAAAAGRLLGLDAEQLTNAFGLAGSQSAGLLQGLHDGSWVKRLHPGWAVQSGITAALLAARGFRGPAAVLDGGWGLYAVLLHGEEPVDAHAVTDGLGTEWLLPDTTYKPYSNGAWNHASMDALAAIMRANGLQHADIERIDVVVPVECMPVVCEPRDAKIHPATPYHMKFSLPYSVAMLAVLGHTDVEDYTDSVLADPRIADLAARTWCSGDPAMLPEGFPARVAVVTTDGRRFEHHERAQRGGPGHPFSASDHRRKFHANAAPSLGEEGAARLADALENAWEVDGVSRLAALWVAR